MIDVAPVGEDLQISIGERQLTVSRSTAVGMSEALRSETIERIADFKESWKSDPWRIEGAQDDVAASNQKSELRRRLLLRHGSRQWHILRSEALNLGSLLRRSLG
jgi:hypothetical protein